MKKSIAPLLFGILFILGGLAYLGNIFFSWDFSIFFDGWWTLFIIVPSFVSILANGARGFNITAFIIGIILLLSQQLPHIFRYRYTGIAIVSVVVISIGVCLISSFFRKGNSSNTTYYQSSSNWQPPFNGNEQATQNQTNANQGQNNYGYQYTNAKNSNTKSWACDENNFPNYTAILSGTDAKNNSSCLNGARISAILGGVDLDLRDAVVSHDIIIYATAIMGGIDIYAPKNIRIAINKTDILGETECHAYTMSPDSGAPTVTFVCTTVMGGIDIK